MEQILSVLTEIRDQLVELNSKIDDLTGNGTNNITDVVNVIDGIKGAAGYDLTDIYNQLDTIDSSISNLDTTIMLKD